MSGAGPIPAKERQHIYRRRRAAGEVVAAVRVTAQDLAMMTRRGVLSATAIQDRQAVGRAIGRLLDAVGGW